MKKKAISVLSLVLILSLFFCTSCSLLSWNKLSQSKIIQKYEDEDYEEVDFDDLKDYSYDFLYDFYRYDGELEDGVYTTINSKNEMRQIFNSDSFLSSIYLESLGLKYDKNMQSATYFTIADYNSSDFYCLTAITIDFDSSSSLNSYFEKLSDDDDDDDNDDDNDADVDFDSGNENGVRYVIQAIESDNQIAYVGMYVSGKSMLIVVGMGTGRLDNKIENCIDDFCEMVDVISPTEA